MEYNQEVVKYWQEHYTDKKQFGICTLCGNTGIIDTRGAKSFAGHLVGRLDFCICKNGQHDRQQAEMEAKK